MREVTTAILTGYAFFAMEGRFASPDSVRERRSVSGARRIVDELRPSEIGRELVRTHAMADVKKSEHGVRADDRSAPPDSPSSLLPMLVWGLVLIIVALIVVTMFV